MVKYPVLISEMALRKITKKKICDLIGIGQKTLWNKLESKNDFTLQEAMMIQKEFFEDIPIELLFSTDGRERKQDK